MDKYKVLIVDKTKDKWEWISVLANPDNDPKEIAETQLKGKYKNYEIAKHLPAILEEKDCHSQKGYDTISLLNEKETNNMTDLLYDFIYMKDYNKNISDLVDMAIPESWSYPSSPSEFSNSILKNYLSKTLERLQEENKIIITNNFCAFNTGLFTPNYESIYLLADKYTNSIDQRNWVFREFCTEYKFDFTDITTLPERADYFTDPSLLIFDWHYPVRVQYGHILDNERNISRLPKCVLESKMKLQLFTGAVDTSIKKVIANYKLAVPQYHEKQIQLLIPLFFEDHNKPDLALAVTKKNGYYQGHTCLTLDMAYSNARLIARPENNWLTL